MRDTVTILGIPIDRVTKKEAGQITEKLIKESNKTCQMIFAPNTEFIMYAQKDEEYYKLLNKSRLSTPDSIGVIIAGKLQHKPFKERIPGQAYFREIIELSNQKGYSIYLLGGEPDIPEKTKENLEKIYPNVNIVGTHHGYFSKEEEKEIIEEINKLQPNVLFVALGAPKQEKWIEEHKNELKVDVAAGQGGTYDYEAGKIRRAPVWIQKIGMEWLWRLILQPSRIIRMRVLPIFLLKILLTKDITKGKFEKE